MNPRIFRQYDIRGVADRDLDDELTGDLGQALGTLLRRDGQRELALGRDCRLHSPRLHAALLAGLLRSGIDVVDIGIVPSPLLYFAVHHLGLGGGAQITASHNPPGDNGFKLLRGTASLHGSGLQELRALIERRDFLHGSGSARAVDIRPAYADFVRARLQLGPRRFPVVLDAGNGTGGVVAEPLVRSLGFPVTGLYCDMDGSFPHHPPDPTVPEHLADLIAEVQRQGAELGLAFDGDADRLAVVDSRGRVIWGDQLMILLARAILADEPGATFVCEVKSSKALYDEIERAGGKAIMWRVGHSQIKEKMREVGAALGGEMSGHLFFAHRYLGFDDAIYAATRLLELLSRSEQPLAAHVDALPRFHNTPELRVRVPESIKLELCRRAAQELHRLPDAQVIDVDGARVHFPGAWALVRASNTEAAVVLRFEAETAERLAAVRQAVEGILERLQRELVPPDDAAGSPAARPERLVEFFYDVGSPYCYLAATQLTELVARTAATVRFVPVVLGRVLAAAGTGPLGAARLRYLQADVGRWARRLKVPLHFPSRFPCNSMQALRLCVQAAQLSEAAHQALALRLLRAYWVEDQDLLDPRSLTRLVQSVGLPAAELLQGCARPEVRDALRDRTEDAIARGVFDAPSFVVDGELFWGNDRLDFVEAALRGRG
jgi:phosphomannomutase/phosphoglucomutase